MRPFGVFLWRNVPLLLAIFLAGCRSTTKSTPARSATTPEAKEAAAKPAPAAPTPAASSPTNAPTAEVALPKLTYSAAHDAEFKAIFDLAAKSKWEEAETRASRLYEADPQDASVQRLMSWVTKQRKLRRQQAVEDKIREIDANNSVFNPTIPDLLKEKKDRGLPPRKDVRDAVEQIDSTPYVPDSYGKTVYRQGALFDLETEQGRMSRILDKEISVHLDNVTLEAIIFNVGQAEGINFVADKSLPAFSQKLSVNLNKVNLREFLRYISRNLDVQFQVGTDLIWIVDAKDPKKLQEETRFYRLKKGFVLPAQFGPTQVTQTKQVNPQNPAQVTAIVETQAINKFVNDGAPVMPALETAITNFFTGSRYFIDYERNLIVARGTTEQLEVLEKIVEEFDKPIQQVLIEARFITVSQPAFMQLGVLWETGKPIAPTRSPADFTGLVGPDNVANVGLGLQEIFTNILGRPNLSATLTALEQSGESQTLSAPRLTVINNRPATISDGKVQYYYEEYTVKTTLSERFTASSFVPAGKPTKLTAGVELDVLASISGDGKNILLALNPRVSQDVKLVTYATLSETDEAGKVTTFDIKLPESRTQELSTRVIVKSGETVAMGGVLEREQTTFVDSVPVLGNIPLLGALFRRRTEIDRPRYLLIFVTATIL
ncbi:MAG TPA: type II secretion system protein GspD [Verrucomicrobiae bacterium]|nr:type II secretion system protein GspD [Verrucomicrobiae bacterium]